MTGIRALTLILDDPSTAAKAVSDVFDGVVDADFESFASVTLPEGVPLWINAPDPGAATTRAVVVHLTTDDVDASFHDAVSRGALPVREPTDMDFGERSACVRLDAVPGVTFDLSKLL